MICFNNPTGLRWQCAFHAGFQIQHEPCPVFFASFVPFAVVLFKKITEKHVQKLARLQLNTIPAMVCF